MEPGEGHQAYQRLLPTHVGKIIRVPPRRRCPKHKGEPLLMAIRWRSTRSSISISPRVGVAKNWSPSMSAKKATATDARNAHPRGIDQFGGQLFDAFQVWVIYQRIILRLPYRVIMQVIEDMFGERASLGTTINFVRYVSGYLTMPRLNAS